MPIINPKQIYPDEFAEDDAAIFTVKILVTRIRNGSTPLYRIYNCPPNNESNGVPQGSRVSNEADICKALFPTLYHAGKVDR